MPLMSRAGPGDAPLAESVLWALESSRTGVTVVMTDHLGQPVRRYANQAFADLLEMSLEEARALAPMDTLVPSELPRIRPLFEAWLTGTPMSRVQTLFQTKSGRAVPVELALARTTLDGAPAGVVFARDVSERAAIEDALRRSESRFRRLAEGAPDGITIHVRGRLVYANPFVLRMLDVGSLEELGDAGILSVLPEEERSEMIARLARVSSGERMEPREYHLLGRSKTVEVGSIAFEHDGQPAVLSFSRDVSDRRRMLDELRRADRLAALGRLSAAVAHEVNNPLTYVLLNLGVLRERLTQVLSGPAATEAQTMLDEALDGAERVRVIVRDLLSFARSDPRSLEPVPVEQAIESAIKLAGNVLRHRATLRRDYSPARPVQATRARLEQVFLNLLVNAAQAVPEDRPGGGVIGIAVRADGDDGVTVEIVDDGAGIDDADLPHVFEPFFTTKPEGSGTGLGLAICRMIVESLGGTISVHSPGGRGTLVRVGLPTTDAPAPSPPPPSPPRAAAPRRGRLLLVDDEVRIGKLLASLVAGAHSVEVVHSGEEALERLQSSEVFDVVFCDLMMPGMTGMDLYEAVCRQRPEMEGRFVFLTGGAFTERAADFVQRPNVTVLLKPFTLAQIEAAILARL